MQNDFQRQAFLIEQPKNFISLESYQTDFAVNLFKSRIMEMTSKRFFI